MLKGTNYLMLNHSTVAAIITDWLKGSWPTEMNTLSVVEITFDPTLNAYKVALAAPPQPVSDTPSPAPSVPPSA